MAYCTQLDVQIAVGGLIKLAQLSDQDNLLGGAVNAAVVDAAIAEACSEIDSYVGHRHAVPLATVPAIVNKKAASWAARVLRANLYNGQPLPDDLEREQIDRTWLEGVAKGIISLGIEPPPPKASIVNDKVSERDPTLLVSRRRLRGYA
jgi:phage gp36-like protein